MLVIPSAGDNLMEGHGGQGRLTSTSHMPALNVIIGVIDIFAKWADRRDFSYEREIGRGGWRKAAGFDVRGRRRTCVLKPLVRLPVVDAARLPEPSTV